MPLSSSCPGSSAARAPVPAISSPTEATHRRTCGVCSPRRSSACRLSAGAVGARSSRCARRNAPRLGSVKSARSILSRMVACCRDLVSATFRAAGDRHHSDALPSAGRVPLVLLTVPFHCGRAAGALSRNHFALLRCRLAAETSAAMATHRWRAACSSRRWCSRATATHAVLPFRCGVPAAHAGVNGRRRLTGGRSGGRSRVGR